MAFCSACGTQLAAMSAFCEHCGSRTPSLELPSTQPGAFHLRAGHQPREMGGTAQKGGFIQTFGLDVRVAILTGIVDTLMFGGMIASFGALYFFEIIAGIVLAVITYNIQKHWYGDDHNAALIKALIIGLVTAIPAPISWLLAIPGGLLGLVHILRGK